MLDIKLLRKDINAAASALARRGYNLDIEQFNRLEENRKSIQIRTQELQNFRNSQSKKIGQAKAAGADIQALLDEVNHLGEKLKSAEAELNLANQALDEFLSNIPNILHESVPDGKSEEQNLEIRRWGEPKHFAFTPKDHVELGEDLGGLDFSAASKITGARFIVMHAAIARLHRALIQFMLDVHINEHGYKEIYIPYIANADSLYGTGQLPKFAEDLFELKSGDQQFYLIPTAEVSVTNLMRDEIIPAEQLPMKLVCHSPCFRSEAGSYGKDTRGMIRQHQFEKVELVHFAKPDESYLEHESLVKNAERILQKLELPYRVMLLCSGDTGFTAAKTYDLEVWLPGQQKYREISSCSNTETFQARRMQARFRHPETNKPELMHTLNGSGLAVGRTLVAIMENYQTEEGYIQIPAALQPYMNGISIIK